MALAKEIMQGGVSAGTARALQGQVSSSVTAAGTTISDATALTKSINYVGTVAASTGVTLPNMGNAESCIVYNAGANALTVYPPTSLVKINQLSAGTGMTLGTNTAIQFHRVSSTQIIGILSA